MTKSTLENWTTYDHNGMLNIWGWIGEKAIIIKDVPVQDYGTGDTLKTDKNKYVLGEPSLYTSI